MSTSAGDRDRTDRASTTVVGADRRVTRYDLVLAVIPLAFLAALALVHAGGLPPRVGVAGASLVGAVVLADAMFLNPPRV